MKKIYTIKEVAKILGRHESFIRSKIKSGHLKAVSLGNQYRIEEVRLQEFIEQGGSAEYPSCENIDGITIEEFCKSMRVGPTLARTMLKQLAENGTIKVFKVKNKLIIPKDIYTKLGLIQNYFLESEDETPTTTDNNEIRLFEDDTSHPLTQNLSDSLSSKKAQSKESNDTLNIIKEIKRLSDMLK